MRELFSYLSCLVCFCVVLFCFVLFCFWTTNLLFWLSLRGLPVIPKRVLFAENLSFWLLGWTVFVFGFVLVFGNRFPRER